jgi:hypothetical protein
MFWAEQKHTERNKMAGTGHPAACTLLKLIETEKKLSRKQEGLAG